MQFFTTTVLALATAVSANTYALYCGDSCSNGTLINSGGSYSGASCTNLDTAQAYCYLVSDETFYKAVVSLDTDCIGTNDAEQVIWPGECYEGPWESYQVVVNL